MYIVTRPTVEIDDLVMSSRITELVVWTDGERQFLVSAYGRTGSFVSFELMPDGELTQRDIFQIDDVSNLDGIGLETVTSGEVWITGLPSATSQILRLNMEGDFVSTPLRSFDGEIGGQIFACVTTEVEQGRFSYTINGADGRIRIDQLVGESASIEQTAYEVDLLASTNEAASLRDLTLIEAGGQQWLIVSASGSDTVISFRINENGDLLEVGRAGAATGLGLNQPEIVVGTQVDGTAMVLVGGSDSSSISVLLVSDSGALIPVDHVVDNLASRFAGVTALVTLEVDGATLVFAGGTDGGISILQLLPTGRLLHLESITDTIETSLLGVTSIAASLDGGMIRVFVASEQEAGISSFEFYQEDLGLTYVTDQVGGEVVGGAGGDRLVASALDVELTGGLGADQFVFEAGYESAGRLGVITDFEAGIDEILFPSFVLLRNLSQLSIESTAAGAVITYADVTLNIYSADGSSLEATDLASALFNDVEHYYVGNAPGVPETNPEPPGQPDLPDETEPPAEPDPPVTPDPPIEPEPPITPAPPDGVVIQGTEADDILSGTDGGDTVYAGGGNDVVAGGGGDDKIYGGNGFDQMTGGLGNDTIYGGYNSSDLRDEIHAGAGDDYVDSGYGNDEVYGGTGDDILLGGFGFDTLIGQSGDDVLSSGPLGDLIFGGEGNDFINGGFGHDRINGGAGGDSFYHLGIQDHGSDWIQDYTSAEGDVLVFAGESAGVGDFQVNVAETQNAGIGGVAEAFVIYKPTGQILWALVDGDSQEEINLQIGSDVFNLLV